MVAKANMTSIRENLVFPVICIVQDEGLKNYISTSNWSIVMNYSSL